MGNGLTTKSDYSQKGFPEGVPKDFWNVFSVSGSYKKTGQDTFLRGFLHDIGDDFTAMLALGGPSEIELHFPQEMVFELVHPSRGKQDRRVPSRHKYVAGAAAVSLGFVKGQVLFAEFVSFHDGRLIGCWRASRRQMISKKFLHCDRSLLKVLGWVTPLKCCGKEVKSLQPMHL